MTDQTPIEELAITSRATMHRGWAVRLDFDNPTAWTFQPSSGLTDDRPMPVHYLTCRVRPDGSLVNVHVIGEAAESVGGEAGVGTDGYRYIARDYLFHGDLPRVVRDALQQVLDDDSGPLGTVPTFVRHGAGLTDAMIQAGKVAPDPEPPGLEETEQ
jgi:hypothetical protein